MHAGVFFTADARYGPHWTAQSQSCTSWDLLLRMSSLTEAQGMIKCVDAVVANVSIMMCPFLARYSQGNCVFVANKCMVMIHTSFVRL